MSATSLLQIENWFERLSFPSSSSAPSTSVLASAEAPSKRGMSSSIPPASAMAARFSKRAASECSAPAAVSCAGLRAPSLPGLSSSTSCGIPFASAISLLLFASAARLQSAPAASRWMSGWLSSNAMSSGIPPASATAPWLLALPNVRLHRLAQSSFWVAWRALSASTLAAFSSSSASLSAAASSSVALSDVAPLSKAAGDLGKRAAVEGCAFFWNEPIILDGFHFLGCSSDVASSTAPERARASWLDGCARERREMARAAFSRVAICAGVGSGSEERRGADAVWCEGAVDAPDARMCGLSAAAAEAVPTVFAISLEMRRRYRGPPSASATGPMCAR